eukprot:6112810-Alexandrium_andersonii.AAC.1
MCAHTTATTSEHMYGESLECDFQHTTTAGTETAKRLQAQTATDHNAQLPNNNARPMNIHSHTTPVSG